MVVTYKTEIVRNCGRGYRRWRLTMYQSGIPIHAIEWLAISPKRMVLEMKPYLFDLRLTERELLQFMAKC